nr:adenylate/guanylate cyclase domain-containing protein [Aldersonia kunmingensis]
MVEIALVVLLVVVVAEAIGLLWVFRALHDARAEAEQARLELTSMRQEVENKAAQRLVTTGREAVKTVWQTADLVRRKGLGAAMRNSIEVLADWAEVERPDLARMTVDGRIVIAFSDIENSTALNEKIGDHAWVRVLDRHDRLVRKRVEEFGGQVVKNQGDGFMLAFTRPAGAVNCCLAIQRSLASTTWKPGTTIKVRIGVHMGSSVRRGDDLFGRNVAMAARVAAQAEGTEILVSEPVRDKLAGTDGLLFSEPRQVEFKGFPGVHNVYSVSTA